MVAVELVTFTPSESFRADCTVVRPAVKALEKAAPGAVKGYFAGIQREDPSVGYLFVVWDNYQSHYDLMNPTDPDSKVYDGILNLLSVAHKGITSIKHFDAEEEAALGALGSPYTSVTLSTFKSDNAKEAYKNGVAIDDVDLKQLFQDTKVAMGSGVVWAEGLCIDKDKNGKIADETLIIFTGHDSIEANAQTAKALFVDDFHPKMKTSLRKVVAEDTKHAELVKIN